MTSATPTVRPIIPTTMRALVQRRYGTSDVLADEMRRNGDPHARPRDFYDAGAAKT